MRARMGLWISGLAVELREVVLRDKPAAMLVASPKGSVPVLVLPNGTVLEESLDIMLWALGQNDPEGWQRNGPSQEMSDLIRANDQDFKHHLDRYKYASRYDGADPLIHRQQGEVFLADLEQRLATHDYLFGPRPCLADMAIFPFVRQFAMPDPAWFETAPYPKVRTWLQGFLAGDVFQAVMGKYRPWKTDEDGIRFSRAGLPPCS